MLIWITRQFDDYFAKQINLQTLCILVASTDVKISTALEKKWGGVRLRITRWTFNACYSIKRRESVSDDALVTM